ncbi:hypothetical protein FJTKL_14570 [Diaporthe vaccinii]|uniref:Rhamnolipids biosynthesis 3-oxoacyl-[acyl-carrier-protein] reductase n=1 Tax=Diaporthe vaccinii TaxID=105482 RepID=A0ABR4E792_9PEZI
MIPSTTSSTAHLPLRRARPFITVASQASPRFLTSFTPISISRTQSRTPSNNLRSNNLRLHRTVPLIPRIQTSRMATQSVAAASHGELNRNSLFNLKGRVALVTGGGSGIGLMITQALAVNGAKVYITGRSGEKLDKVKETYGKDIEGDIIPLSGFDVTSKDHITKLVKEVESREKCLCILVNNAGISSNTVTTETDDTTQLKKNLFDAEGVDFQDWTSAYSTNVAAVYFTSAAFLPLLQKSSDLHEGWSGTILNITSISGMIQKAQHHFSYNASKGAAIHLTRMLASEVTSNGHKVRINSLAPGVFPSEMTAGESDEYQKSHIPKEKYDGKFPANRPGRDVDMAQAVLFAVTNQYLNGQNFAVDGGYTIAAGL